jgi:hypothetical protein
MNLVTRSLPITSRTAPQGSVLAAAKPNRFSNSSISNSFTLVRQADTNLARIETYAVCTT